MSQASRLLERPSLPKWVKVMLALWIITLPVTLPLAAMSGMAAIDGEHWYVYVFILAGFTYPVSVGFAFLFRRRRPEVVFLPCLNVVLWILAGSLGRK